MSMKMLSNRVYMHLVILDAATAGAMMVTVPLPSVSKHHEGALAPIDKY